MDNPFLTGPRAVLTVRHVRITPAGETVREDANALHRYLTRQIPLAPVPATAEEFVVPAPNERVFVHSNEVVMVVPLHTGSGACW